MFQTSSIPKIFHKTDGGLLEACIMCGKNLMSPPQEYLLEKAFNVLPEYKRRDVIVEYAICMKCAEEMRNELSNESRQRIEDYFRNNVDFTKRQNLFQPKRLPFQNWIKECLIKGDLIKHSKEFSLYGHAIGKKLIYDIFPYAVSSTAMEEVNSLLSDKTRDVLDDFIGRHFSGPPEVAEILKKRPVLV